MKKFFESSTKKTLKEFKSELGRAHLLIALMAITLILVVAMGSMQAVVFDARLSAVCIALLSIIVILSLSMSITLFRKK